MAMALFSRLESFNSVSILKVLHHLFPHRVYNLVKQMLTKKLMTTSKWISSIAVHPGGDNVITGSYDARLTWFDLDLSAKPYRTLRHHKRAIRQVRA